jgi:hypothetical protein
MTRKWGRGREGTGVRYPPGAKIFLLKELMTQQNKYVTEVFNRWHETRRYITIQAHQSRQHVKSNTDPSTPQAITTKWFLSTTAGLHSVKFRFK